MTTAREGNLKALYKDADKKDKALNDLARVAEAAERYEDMCFFMKAMVEECQAEFLKDENNRNLLSVAYKNVVGAKRSSWRTLSSGTFTDISGDLLSTFKKKVEDELEAICNEIINLLKNVLVPATKECKDETKVFYLKMCGDYYRYLSEFKEKPDKGDDDTSFKEKCKEYYEKAWDSAKEELPETHPTRLGLALNFSVCYYEILKKPDKACELAKAAFDAAIEKLDTLNDSSYKDSTLIMQLLRDNLTLWTSEEPGDAEQP